MKSEVLYNKLIFIDTILSFDGIISSLPDFQLKLIVLIEQLHLSLIYEERKKNEIDNLCRIICFYLDKRINSRLDRNFSSWDRFFLEKYFYGYDKDKHSIYYRINILTKTSDAYIYAYTYKLLSRIAYIIGYDEEITALLSKCNTQDTYGPYINKTITHPEFIENSEYSVINTSKKSNHWIYKTVLQVVISVAITSIVWLFCHNYINSI